MPWTSFSALFTPEADTAISDGQPILATQIEALYNRSDAMLDWFKAANAPYGMPGKINLFTSTSSEASIRIPSGADPTSPAVGDIWNNGGLLKFRSADGASGTKTLAFTDSSFTTITASGNVSAGGTLSATGDTTLNSSTTIKSNLNDTLKVVRTSTDKTKFSVNALGSTVHIGDGTTFAVFSGDVGVGTATFSVTPAGAVTASGSLNVSGALTVGGNITGPINVTGEIQRSGTAYLSPASLHTAGFTVNLGNGTQTISSGAQLPVVVFPYQCNAVAWSIVANETGSTNVTAVEIKLTIQRRLASSNTSAFVDVANTTMTLNSGSSQATGTFTGISFAQGDAIRFVVASATPTPTAKSVAVHVRVTRT